LRRELIKKDIYRGSRGTSFPPKVRSIGMKGIWGGNTSFPLLVSTLTSLN
jgi:hypothetical protein